MTRRHRYPADKHPRHPQALRLRDVRAGMRITIMTSIDSYHGTVLTEPYVGIEECTSVLLVDVLIDGNRWPWCAEDISLIKRPGGRWSDHYVVRDRTSFITRR